MSNLCAESHFMSLCHVVTMGWGLSVGNATVMVFERMKRERGTHHSLTPGKGVPAMWAGKTSPKGRPLARRPLLRLGLWFSVSPFFGCLPCASEILHDIKEFPKAWASAPENTQLLPGFLSIINSLIFWAFCK